MNRRYAPSATLLLHIAVVMLGSLIALSSTTAVELRPREAGSPATEIQLQSPARFTVGIVNRYELPQGSRWRAAGVITQGTVYRPLNDVFMLQARTVDEAYPVLQGAALKGFYLPRERRFSPIQPCIWQWQWQWQDGRQACSDQRLSFLASGTM